MKIVKVGVYHHDCWGSFSTKDHPNISMTELGAVRVVKHTSKGVLVNAFFRMTGNTSRDLINYLDYLKTIPSIKQLKIFHQKGNEAYPFVQFLSSTSSYDSVLKTNAMPVGSIVQEKELEIHSVVTEAPRQTLRLLNDLEALGEVKVMRIGDLGDEDAFAMMTPKQQHALWQAMQNNYYSWPRKITIDKLSKKLGIKRRTFQERLRLAEAKFIPFCVEKLIKEKRI